MLHYTIGVDVSKDTLDAFSLVDGRKHQFKNDAEGHKAFLAWCGPGIERVVFEPTGPYHRTFETALVKAGFPVAKVNPRQARRFAEATGKLAKTDSLDAEMLARMGVALAIEPKPGKSDLMLELKELMVARTALIKERTAQRNRSKWHTLDVLKTQMANRLKQIANDLKELDAEIKSRIDNDAVLARHYAILSSIPGFGFVAAIVLLIELPELGTLEAGKVACLAGLAPITRQSGQWRGRAHIYAGRATVRTGLYMPALVATRFNPDMKAKYDSMVKAGKMAKVAITAIMRKMVVLANVLIKEDRLWELKSA